MAKPHRMALLTFASLLSIAELILIEQHGTVMQSGSSQTIEGLIAQQTKTTFTA